MNVSCVTYKAIFYLMLCCIILQCSALATGTVSIIVLSYVVLYNTVVFCYSYISWQPPLLSKVSIRGWVSGQMFIGVCWTAQGNNYLTFCHRVDIRSHRNPFLPWTQTSDCYQRPVEIPDQCSAGQNSNKNPFFCCF